VISGLAFTGLYKKGSYDLNNYIIGALESFTAKQARFKTAVNRAPLYIFSWDRGPWRDG
jgi:hypothetical protein